MSIMSPRTQKPAVMLRQAGCLLTFWSAAFAIGLNRSNAGPPAPDWSSFLTFRADAIDPQQVPIAWTPADVAWQTRLAGYGQSSPVLWHDRLYVTTVEGPMKDVYHVSCLDATTGEINWVHTFNSSWPSESSTRVSRAAPTPTVDDEGVYAFFESGDLICLGHDGKARWSRALQRDWGEFVNRFGISSSPVQTERSLIVLVDHEGDSRLAAIDKQTGHEQWVVPRGTRSRTWASPGLLCVGDATLVVCSSSGTVDGYLADDGTRVFSTGDVGGNTAATPIDLGQGEFLVSSLIRLADGPSEDAVTSNRKMKVSWDSDSWRLESFWVAESARGGFCSPIADKDCCYWLNPVGVLFCLDRESGREHYARRLSCGACWATPLIVGDRLYVFGKDGETVVARTGPTFELLSEANRVWPADDANPATEQPGQPRIAAEDPIQAAPTLYSVLAIDGALLFRRGEWLYRVNHR